MTRLIAAKLLALALLAACLAAPAHAQTELPHAEIEGVELTLLRNGRVAGSIRGTSATTLKDGGVEIGQAKLQLFDQPAAGDPQPAKTTSTVLATATAPRVVWREQAGTLGLFGTFVVTWLPNPDATNPSATHTSMTLTGRDATIEYGTPGTARTIVVKDARDVVFEGLDYSLRAGTLTITCEFEPIPQPTDTSSTTPQPSPSANRIKLLKLDADQGVSAELPQRVSLPRATSLDPGQPKRLRAHGTGRTTMTLTRTGDTSQVLLRMEGGVTVLPPVGELPLLSGTTFTLHGDMTEPATATGPAEQRGFVPRRATLEGRATARILDAQGQAGLLELTFDGDCRLFLFREAPTVWVEPNRTGASTSSRLLPMDIRAREQLSVSTGPDQWTLSGSGRVRARIGFANGGALGLDGDSLRLDLDPPATGTDRSTGAFGSLQPSQIRLLALEGSDTTPRIATYRGSADSVTDPTRRVIAVFAARAAMHRVDNGLSLTARDGEVRLSVGVDAAVLGDLLGGSGDTAPQSPGEFNLATDGVLRAWLDNAAMLTGDAASGFFRVETDGDSTIDELGGAGLHLAAGPLTMSMTVTRDPLTGQSGRTANMERARLVAGASRESGHVTLVSGYDVVTCSAIEINQGLTNAAGEFRGPVRFVGRSKPAISVLLIAATELGVTEHGRDGLDLVLLDSPYNATVDMRLAAPLGQDSGPDAPPSRVRLANPELLSVTVTVTGAFELRGLHTGREPHRIGAAAIDEVAIWLDLPEDQRLFMSGGSLKMETATVPGADTTKQRRSIQATVGAPVLAHGIEGGARVKCGGLTIQRLGDELSLALTGPLDAQLSGDAASTLALVLQSAGEAATTSGTPRPAPAAPRATGSSQLPIGGGVSVAASESVNMRVSRAFRPVIGGKLELVPYLRLDAAGDIRLAARQQPGADEDVIQCDRLHAARWILPRATVTTDANPLDSLDHLDLQGRVLIKHSGYSLGGDRLVYDRATQRFLMEDQLVKADIGVGKQVDGIEKLEVRMASQQKDAEQLPEGSRQSGPALRASGRRLTLKFGGAAKAPAASEPKPAPEAPAKDKQ